MRPRLPAILLVPGGLGLRLALDRYRRFFGLRSLLAVSSVASGRIEFVSRAYDARQLYGLSIRFQLLSTARHHAAVTFNSWREAPPQRDFHPPMHALSQAHERRHPCRRRLGLRINRRQGCRRSQDAFARGIMRIAARNQLRLLPFLLDSCQLYGWTECPIRNTEHGS